MEVLCHREPSPTGRMALAVTRSVFRIRNDQPRARVAAVTAHYCIFPVTADGLAICWAFVSARTQNSFGTRLS